MNKGTKSCLGCLGISFGSLLILFLGSYVYYEWIILLDKLDDALTHDGNRHSAERAASYMLMKWASIVTEK